MSINKKVFTTALALLVATGISTVKAQEAAVKDNAVLFKVHDISPVKNNEGEVVACDFNTTFYNRSPLKLRDASVELAWTDKSLENIINAEKKADSSQNGSGRGYSPTERASDKTVKVMVEVPGLNPYKQTTVKTRVNTDRCFLLIGKTDFTMRTCNAESTAAAENRRRRGNNSECSRLFKYVSPEDPQYYQEFKEVSVDEEEAMAESKRQEEKDEFNKLYTSTVETIGNTGSIISGIK